MTKVTNFIHFFGKISTVIKMNEILIEQCSYLIDDTLPNIANI